MNFEPHLLSFSLKPMLGLEMDKDLCKSLAPKWRTKFLLVTSPREERERETGRERRRRKLIAHNDSNGRTQKPITGNVKATFWAFLHKRRQNAEVFCPAFGLHFKLRGTV